MSSSVWRRAPERLIEGAHFARSSGVASTRISGAMQQE